MATTSMQARRATGARGVDTSGADGAAVAVSRVDGAGVAAPAGPLTCPDGGVDDGDGIAVGAVSSVDVPSLVGWQQWQRMVRAHAVISELLQVLEQLLFPQINDPADLAVDGICESIGDSDV